jgi:hypothetical protein
MMMMTMIAATGFPSFVLGLMVHMQIHKWFGNSYHEVIDAVMGNK